MKRQPAFKITLIIILFSTNTNAQWSTNPDVNNAISVVVNDENSPTIAADGAGGAIITWQDNRNGPDSDIYAQRIDAAGTVQGPTNGVAICVAVYGQAYPKIVSDGAGGVIITWQDNRSGPDLDIYAQNVNAAGAVQWTTDGVAICTAVNNQSQHMIISDGAGGAIITWHDFRSGSNYDIYAQRINAAGTVQWSADGIAICTAVDDQRFPTIVSDGAGGAIITWHDRRSGSNAHIYAQRVNATGAVQWAADGLPICTAANAQMWPTIISDGLGGAIITWEDDRTGSTDIYTQHVNAMGTVQWTANGVAICTAVNFQGNPSIVSDGAGGAIITWEDKRSGSDFDIYAQRVNAAGAVQWTANGVAICTAVDVSGLAHPTITSDGAGGAIINWQDNRNGTYDIYTQRVNAAGAFQWTANGVAICTAVKSQVLPKTVSDGAGGAIITWQDYRSGTSYDIYAQNVCSDGIIGGTGATLATPGAISGLTSACTGMATIYSITPIPGATSYNWSLPGGWIGASSTNSISVTASSSSGSISVYGSNACGISSVSSLDITVDPCTGITNASGALSNLTIYPNPGNGEFTVQLENGYAKTIEIIDYTGKIVLIANDLNDPIIISLSGLDNGIYSVKIQSNNGSKVVKVAKQ